MKAQASSLRRRTFIFLTLLLAIGSIEVLLLVQAQNRITETSQTLRETLTPTQRLLEQLRLELDLQAQELHLINASKSPLSQGPASLGILRLGPAAKALLRVENEKRLPESVQKAVSVLTEDFRSYESRMRSFEQIADALPSLQQLRDRAQFALRATDRESALQLLELQQGSSRFVDLGILSLVFGALLVSSFLLIEWRWMLPLEKASRWIKQISHPEQMDTSTLAPPSVLGSGFLSPPREVQDLIEALRFFEERHKVLTRDLQTEANRNREVERSVLGLVAALQVFARHNEELVQELIKKERLASMGEMAAELAHEIRNPLNSLSLKIELLREEVPKEFTGSLDQLLLEIDRLDALTESHLRTTRAQLSTVRAPKLTPATTLNDIIDQCKPEFAAEDVTLELDLPRESVLLPCPANVLKAVVLNLLKNAREAISEARKQNLSSAGRVRVVVSLLSGRRFKISILDSGIGFSSKLKQKDFPSFQTTKDHGSGLGLATAKKMLEAYSLSLKIEDVAPAPFATEMRIEGTLATMETQEQVMPI